MKTPEINLKGLEDMTDKFGMLQFANGSEPDRSKGYTLDDNARALIVASQLGREDLADIYLKFIQNAQIVDGRFVNVFNRDGKPTEELGSEDSFGRTIWALGESYKFLDEERKRIMEGILEKAKPRIENLEPIRSKAFTILGLTKLNQTGNRDMGPYWLINNLACSLVNDLDRESTPDWRWFEDTLTYENARLPQALIRAYQATKNDWRSEDILIERGLESLAFLSKVMWETKEDGQRIIIPVGNNKGGWYKKGGRRPKYDQQPVDVGAAVECYVDAYLVTGREEYLQMAEDGFEWFTGRNSEDLEMYDHKTGRVYDGLEQGSRNQNKGAEALLSFPMAALRLAEATT